MQYQCNCNLAIYILLFNINHYKDLITFNVFTQAHNSITIHYITCVALIKEHSK